MKELDIHWACNLHELAFLEKKLPGVLVGRIEKYVNSTDWTSNLGADGRRAPRTLYRLIEPVTTIPANNPYEFFRDPSFGEGR